jgi:hypothetical protein
MHVSVQEKKVVVYDAPGPMAQNNKLFGKRLRTKERWYRYSSVYL